MEGLFLFGGSFLLLFFFDDTRIDQKLTGGLFGLSSFCRSLPNHLYLSLDSYLSHEVGSKGLKWQYRLYDQMYTPAPKKAFAFIHFVGITA